MALRWARSRWCCRDCWDCAARRWMGWCNRWWRRRGRCRSRTRGATLTCHWSSDARRDRPRLNIDTRPVPVFRSRVGSTIRETELADMPVLWITRCSYTNGSHYLCEGSRTIWRPKRYWTSTEVNIVRKVIPVSGNKLGRPLGLTVDTPAKRVIRCALLSR